jgi:hypothetical protein
VQGHSSALWRAGFGESEERFQNLESKQFGMCGGVGAFKVTVALPSLLAGPALVAFPEPDFNRSALESNDITAQEIAPENILPRFVHPPTPA